MKFKSITVSIHPHPDDGKSGEVSVLKALLFVSGQNSVAAFSWTTEEEGDLLKTGTK